MKKYITIISITLLGLASCRPDPYKDIGARQGTTDGLNGSWQVSKVEVIDLTTPVPEARDLSDFYLGQSDLLGLSFNVSDNSYTVQNSSVPTNPFGSSGSYSFDDDNYPSKITFISSDMDTVNADLAGIVRSIDAFAGFSVTKSHCDENYVVYSFTFKRQ